MAVKFASGGPDGVAEKTDAWAPFLAVPDDLSLASEAEVEIGFSDPYRVFLLDPLTVIEGSIAESLAPIGWRHLLQSGETIIGELEIDENGDPVALHTGPASQHLVQAVSAAEQMDEDIVASVVTSPGLRLNALWLETGNDYRLVAFPPDDTLLPQFESVSEDVALEVLRPLAKSLLEANAEATATVNVMDGSEVDVPTN